MKLFLIKCIAVLTWGFVGYAMLYFPIRLLMWDMQGASMAASSYASWGMLIGLFIGYKKVRPNKMTLLARLSKLKPVRLVAYKDVASTALETQLNTAYQTICSLYGHSDDANLVWVDNGQLTFSSRLIGDKLVTVMSRDIVDNFSPDQVEDLLHYSVAKQLSVKDNLEYLLDELMPSASSMTQGISLFLESLTNSYEKDKGCGSGCAYIIVLLPILTVLVCVTIPLGIFKGLLHLFRGKKKLKRPFLTKFTP